MGGRPNPGTKKDMRLARNNPNAGKQSSKGAKSNAPKGMKKLNTQD